MAKDPGSTRLQKLLILLESSTDATRKAAGKQICEIAKAHPSQLTSIIRKVHGFSYSKNWDARVAAGETLGLLADAFPHHTPADLEAAAGSAGPSGIGGSSGDAAGEPRTAVPRSTSALAGFVLQQVLAKGKPLLASGGQEFEACDESLPPAERLAKQRVLLKQRLGLGKGLEGFADDDLLDDDEVAAAIAAPLPPKRAQSPTEMQPPAELLCSSLSARERNRLKRKAKSGLARSDSVRSTDSRGAGTTDRTASKDGIMRQASISSAPGTQAAIPEAKFAEQEQEEWRQIEAGAWPFQHVADQLCCDILDSCWEVRHGAAVALRELMRSQAGSAGVVAPVADAVSGWCEPGGEGKRRLAVPIPAEDVAQAKAANAAWLEECLMLLLCVLALDRFADYLSDQVVAPVRETAAQTLAAAVRPVTAATAQRVLTILQDMQRQKEWGVRHGGFTGMKYLLAARVEDGEQLLPVAMPSLLQGLQDDDDDCRAAAADALLPMTLTLLAMGQQTVSHLRKVLWELLPQLEELSPATSSALALLAKLHSPPAAFVADGTLAGRVPLLWPFFDHPLSSVRQSSLQCMERLVAGVDSSTSNGSGSNSTWLVPVLGPSLRLSFQALVVEADARVQGLALKVWRALLEHAPVEAVAKALSPDDLRSMLALAATPVGQLLDARYLVTPRGNKLVPLQHKQQKQQQVATSSIGSRPAKKTKREHGGSAEEAMQRCSSLDLGQVVGSSGQEAAVRLRSVAGQALGMLAFALQRQEHTPMPGLLMQLLQHSAATPRLLAGLALCSWLRELRTQLRQQSQPQAQQQQDDPEQPESCSAAQAAAIASAVPPQLSARCLELLAAPGPCAPSPPGGEPYAEVAPMYARLRQLVMALLNECLKAGWMLHTPNNVPVELLSSDAALAMLATVPAGSTEQVAAANEAVQNAASHLQMLEAFMHCSTCLALAAAVVHAGQLPPKLNIIIQNLMHPLRKEPSPILQQLGADALAELVACCVGRQPCPNPKVLMNLCSMACCDPADTPSVVGGHDEDRDDTDETAVLELRRVSNSQAGTSNGTAPAASVSAGAAATGATAVEAAALRTTRQGAERALKALCVRFGPSLFQQLPGLWDHVAAALTAAGGDNAAGIGSTNAPTAAPQELINALQIMKVVVPALHHSLLSHALGLLPALCACCGHSRRTVRTAAARCAAALGAALPDEVLPPLLRLLLPGLEGTAADDMRRGAVDAVAQLVALMQAALVPYAVLLLVPLMRRMSDHLQSVRKQATTCFGALMPLLPLAQGIPLPQGLDPAQRSIAERDGAFLSQLLDNRRVDDYVLPMPLKVQLRQYQQEGINWLAFLRRFGLHGVLADDMGLGKTLQATAIMASSAAEARATAAAAHTTNGTGADAAMDAALSPKASTGAEPGAAAAAGSSRHTTARGLPSLVVCPSTLVAHWEHEISKYVGLDALQPLQISSTPTERAAAQKLLPSSDVAIMSYEALRSDADWAASVHWDYVILDEGHVIRSAKSKLAAAVRRLSAQHRLILSGTPIQNDVLELWSLFDFLMPGFLGDQRSFNARFGKALQAAKHSKRGSKEAEAGLLAVGALHKQVLPFVLRRTKQQVLHDLPPKIITDVVCELSAFQAKLYENFATSAAVKEVAGALQQQAGAASGDSSSGSTAGKPPQHVFAALLYLRKLCSHPLLALDWSMAAHQAAAAKLLDAHDRAAAERALRGLQHAPKLQALRDILTQCGIGADGAPGDAGDSAESALAAGDSGHRVLVFAQLKGMLDIVARDLLGPLGVPHLRIDGGVEASARFSIVQRFNSDPTIPVLLLTTHVGGLGLNLTSADTVVFLEHDWNPMKDLQAMDRAHRLGQTRTVNVYRLLMKGTLEEHIMGLQQFKLDVANAVVNADNVSLSAMDTTQLLDLFAPPGPAAAPAGAPAGAVAAGGGEAGAGADADAAAAAAASGKGRKSALQQVLDAAGELWDESQYEQEFDVAAFMRKLDK